MVVHFEKYEGLGNDFLICQTSDISAWTFAQVQALCDRHFGIGADGVLLVSPAEHPEARARMIVLNADGSRPEMCGNGLRCVALYLARQAGETESSFTVETDAGLRECQVSATESTGQVTTGLGQGRAFEPFTERLAHEELTFTRISMGNPHAICFRAPLSSQELDELGPRISARWPEGTNVEIATLHEPTQIRVDVWERGVGRTLACGTGAAATAVAAVLAGHSPANTPLEVRLPGGPLLITVESDLNVSLTGPARWVYSGHWSERSFSVS